MLSGSDPSIRIFFRIHLDPDKDDFFMIFFVLLLDGRDGGGHRQSADGEAEAGQIGRCDRCRSSGCQRTRVEFTSASASATSDGCRRAG